MASKLIREVTSVVSKNGSRFYKVEGVADPLPSVTTVSGIEMMGDAIF
jgi:hypothetical protein